MITPIGMCQILAILAFMAGGSVRAQGAILCASWAASANLATAKFEESIRAAFFALRSRCQVSLILAFSGVGCVNTSLHVTRASWASVACFLDASTIGTIWAGILTGLIGSQVGVVLAQGALPLTQTCLTGWRANLAETTNLLRSLVVIAIRTFIGTAACGSEV